jgi:hypothetical protein
MLSKYFELNDGVVTCKQIQAFGNYGRVFNEYQAIHDQLTSEIQDLDIRLLFQNSVIEKIKTLHPDEAFASNCYQVEGEDVLIGKEDFPDNYVNMAHAGDYKPSSEAISPSFIYNRGGIKHDRIIARVAWKCPNGSFMPMSYICDTGATRQIYLSKLGFLVLAEKGLIMQDPELGTKYALVNGKKVAILPTPITFEPANLIGLPLLARFGLTLSPDGNVSFSNFPSYF